MKNFNAICLTLVLLFFYILSGTNKENAQILLRKKGFTEIVVGDYAWSGRDGLNRTKFTARCNNVAVSGYVGYWFVKNSSNIVIE